MGETIDILQGKINYVGEEVDEEFAPIAKATDLDTFMHVKIDMNHKVDEGHFIFIRLKLGLVKRGTNIPVLVIESTTEFKIAPYDKVFFKKPASVSLTKLMLELIQTACHQSRGMFAVVRESYKMHKDAMPGGMHPTKIKNLIWEDMNRELLS